MEAPKEVAFFSLDSKPHSIDIRIVVKNGGLILRICVDCELFNVRERGEVWRKDSDGVLSNIRIRMTMASAKYLNYITPWEPTRFSSPFSFKPQLSLPVVLAISRETDE